MLVWMQHRGEGAQLNPHYVRSRQPPKQMQQSLLWFRGWVIGPLIYCSRLQTWSGSWLELRQQQKYWEQNSSLSAKNPRLTGPVWGEWHRPPPTGLRSPPRDVHWQFGIPSCRSVEPIWFWVALISCLCLIEKKHASHVFLSRFHPQCHQ